MNVERDGDGSGTCGNHERHEINSGKMIRGKIIEKMDPMRNGMGARGVVTDER
jgi:hypothetical protein